MNFEDSTYPLTEFLSHHSFSVTKREQHFIEYYRNSAIITVAYANLEYVLYTHVGQNRESLVELTPIAVKEVFGDNSFQFQSTLTIDNLISFFKTAGKSILSGDNNVFKELHEFSEHRSRDYTKKLIHFQNVQGADRAWTEKDYADFVRCIDRAEKDLLPESYLKKYRIALDKIGRKIE